MFYVPYTGWDHFDASEVGFKELFQVYELVTKELGHEAIVLDADDLLKNPGAYVFQLIIFKEVEV